MKKKYLLITFFIIVFIIGFMISWFRPAPLFSAGFTSFNIYLDDQTVNEEEKHFSFMVIGDNHNNLKVYNKVIGKTNKSDSVFFVDLGDSTQSGKNSEYIQTKSALSKLKVPYYMVVGNHDIKDSGFDLWKKYFGQTYYSWDYENAHFIVLDDVTDSDNNAFSEEELNWLEDDLLSTQKDLKFIFIHVPPRYPPVGRARLGFVPKSGFSGTESKKRIDRFFDIAKKYEVDKIYASHLHNFWDYSISDIPITIVSTTGGAIFNIPFINKMQYYYAEVEVYKDSYQQKIKRL